MKKYLSPYERGKRWGYAIFKSNLELFGKRGLGKSDATAIVIYLECKARYGMLAFAKYTAELRVNCPLTQT